MYYEGLQKARYKMIYYNLTFIYKKSLYLSGVKEKSENRKLFCDATFYNDFFSLFEPQALFVVQHTGNWLLKVKWKKQCIIATSTYETMLGKYDITNEFIFIKYNYFVQFPEFIEDFSNFAKNVYTYQEIMRCKQLTCKSSLNFFYLTLSVPCVLCKNVYYYIYLAFYINEII